MEALALDLKGRLDGHAIAQVYVAAFSALKTFDPPVQALEGTLVDDVTRHGKFLDIEASGLHLVFHLARAGWIRWKDELPPRAASPQQQVGPRGPRRPRRPERARRDGGRHQEEPRGVRRALAGTTYPASPASAPTPSTTPSPATPSPTSWRTRAAPRSRACSATRARSRASATPTATRSCTQRRCRRSSRPTASPPGELDQLFAAIKGELGDAVDRSRGLAASELKGEKKTNLAVHGRAGEKCPVCGDTVREVSFADSSLQYCPTCQTGGKPLADRRLSRLLK